jgi:hypothetical protein
MQRPGGVTFIAVLDFIGGAIFAVCALIAFAGGSFIASLISAANQGAAGAGSTIAAGVGIFIGVVLMAFAALAIVTGLGLLKLRGWGRIIQLVLTIILLLLSIKNFFSVGMHVPTTSLVVEIAFLVYYAWVVWYLFTPGVKAAFAGQPPAAA